MWRDSEKTNTQTQQPLAFSAAPTLTRGAPTPDGSRNISLSSNYLSLRERQTTLIISQRHTEEEEEEELIQESREKASLFGIFVFSFLKSCGGNVMNDNLSSYVFSVELIFVCWLNSLLLNQNKTDI